MYNGNDIMMALMFDDETYLEASRGIQGGPPMAISLFRAGTIN
jgi:hypothetical protein